MRRSLLRGREPAGRIQVSNEVRHATRSVMVSRPGFGTVIEGENAPPTPPAMIPPEELHALQAEFVAHQPHAPARDPDDREGQQDPDHQARRGADAEDPDAPRRAW